MNILFINFLVEDLWFLRYREFPYSGTVRIRLLSHIKYINIVITIITIHVS